MQKAFALGYLNIQYSMAIRWHMHYLCIYPCHKIHKHLLSKFSWDVSHALALSKPPPPITTFSSLAIANKFTSKVFICICLAASPEKDAPAPRIQDSQPAARPVQISFSFQLSISA